MTLTNPNAKSGTSMLTDAAPSIEPIRRARIPPEDLLRKVLSDGPQRRAHVLGELAKAGVSEKQVRVARERIGIVIRRSGRRTEMTSTWELPDQAIRARSDADSSFGESRRFAVKKREIGQQVQPASADTASVAPAGIRTESRRHASQHEQDLADRRIEFFVHRGMLSAEAHALAQALTYRDLAPWPKPISEGSCFECEAERDCQARKDRAVIHECWSRRRIGP